MQNILSDLRYALRQFRLSPAFTLTAVLTLALGIGGTTAIFSLIHTVMLRSLPVADPASLYRIGDGTTCCMQGSPQDNWGMFSYPLFERLKKETPEFEELAAFQAGQPRLSVRRASLDQVARPLRGEFVTGNYFSTFGIRSFAGRLFSASDDKASAAPTAVLSYHTWQGQYAGDPSVVGASYIVDGHPFTIVGIAPPGFYGETLRSDPPDIWLPVQQEPLLNGEGSVLHQPISSWLRVIGRLRPGATVAGMPARLTGVLRQYLQNESGYPAVWMPMVIQMLPKQIVHVVPAGSGVAAMKSDYGRSLNILLSVCCLVLLIACANVANLLLARGIARRSQTSLRLAIGASRSRIVIQSLAESILLAIAGGIAGLAVADGAGSLLLALAFQGSQHVPIGTTPSLPVLAFAFGLSLLTAILFGTAPAWFATRTDPVEALRGANRSTQDRSSFSRKALLVVQATLSVVLIAGAGMLARSLNNLEHQRFGFQTANRLSVLLSSPPASYNEERLNALYRTLEERLNQIPGVDGAGIALYNPFADNWGEDIVVEGQRSTGLSDDANASWDRVSPNFFQLLGQPLLRGRAFTKADSGTAAPVAVVNEAFVHKFFPKQDPLDRHFGIDLPENAGTFRVVGIVRNAKYTQPDQPVYPMFFVPLAQHETYPQDLMQKLELRSHFAGSVLIVTHLSPAAIESSLRKALAEADADMTVVSVRTMQQQVDLNFDQQRAVAGLAGLFGIVALLLAAIGLYGVTAYTVAQRTGEIGVRMALGADRSSVINLVLTGAFRRVALGLLLGIPLAVGAGRLMSSQLYNVANWDPLALLIAVVSLGLCAFLAAIIPATRAASIDPMKALRSE